LCRIALPYCAVCDGALWQRYGIKTASKIDDKGNTNCEVTTPDDKMNVVCKLRGDVSAVAVGRALRSCFVF
jgi:hypothetical protein